MATFVCPMRTSLYTTAQALMSHPKVQEARVPFTVPSTRKTVNTALAAYDAKAKPNLEATITSPIQYPKAIVQFQDMIEHLENPDKMQAKIMIGDKPVTVTYNITESGAVSEMVAFGRGGSYEHLSGAIEKTKERLDVTDAQIAEDISNALQGKPLSQQDEAYEKFVARMTWLLFGTESGRNPATLVTAPMMLDLIQNHEMTFANFLNDDKFDGSDPAKGGGLFPMSFRGAVPASRTIYKGNRYKGPPGSADEIAEMEARETQLLETWRKANKVPPGGVPAALAKLAQNTYDVPLAA